MNTSRWKTAIALFTVAAFLAAQQPVQLQTIKGVATSVGNGTTDSGTLRVTLASDGTGQVAIAGTPAVTITGTANSLPQSSSTYAASAFDLSATAATQVKGTAGNVWGWFGSNPNTTTCYLQFYNSASATLGASPLHQFGVVAGGSFNLAPGSMALFNMSTAISTGQTTTAAGATPCSSAMTVTILYN